MKLRLICLALWSGLGGCGKDIIEGTGAEASGSSTGASTSTETTEGPSTTPTSTGPGTSEPDSTTTTTGVTPDTTTTSEPTTVDPTTTTEDPSTTTTTETSTETSTTTDETSTGPDDTSSSSDESTSTGGMDCVGMQKISRATNQAVLSEDWGLDDSLLGEGEIIKLSGGTEGQAIYNVDIPCDATWHIWVRMLNYFGEDSFHATVDGQPNPPAIVAADCGGGGMSWSWKRLNIHDNNCTVVDADWTQDWTAGAHAIAFSYRNNEADSLGRIFLTNDPDYVPGNMD